MQPNRKEEMHNKKIELTTKAEPILGEFKDLSGFCVSSFSAISPMK